MGVQPLSFLLGLGAAWVLPMLTRVLRPLVVEATVAGMALVDESRRVLAEQLEVMEDIAAEARARREEMLAPSNGHHEDAEDVAGAGGDIDETTAAPRGRRRANGAGRRRAS
jgi:uncharacterized protein DUF5132